MRARIDRSMAAAADVVGRASLPTALAVLLLSACISGCQTTAAGRSGATRSWPSVAHGHSAQSVALIPPAPAPEQIRMGMSALPRETGASLGDVPALPQPSSRSSRPAMSATNTAPVDQARTLAPAETSFLEEPPKPAPPMDDEPDIDERLEARLQTLEEECRQKLTDLQTLSAQHDEQSREVAALRQALEESRNEIHDLTEIVGEFHQRDLASLEQLTALVDQLLIGKSTPAAESDADTGDNP